jgi:hypothetical protein
VSIITNTNWQSYGGESPLSNFRQNGRHHGDLFLLQPPYRPQHDPCPLAFSNRSRLARPLQDSQANHNRPYM